MALENFYVKAKRVLVDVVKATKDGGFLYVEEKTGEWLQSKGWVERNFEIKNEAGEVATRATDAGIAEVPVETKEKKVMSAGVFAIENVPVEKAKRRPGGRSNGIPYDLMEVGQSVFFPVTEDTTLAGLLKKLKVSAASAETKFSDVERDSATGEPVMRKITRGPNAGTEVACKVKMREFAANEAEKDGVKGVRVGRIK